MEQAIFVGSLVVGLGILLTFIKVVEDLLLAPVHKIEKTLVRLDVTVTNLEEKLERIESELEFKEKFKN